ncbi:hypothetical protein CAPTEDRAFT_209065 [Capitella teleta]|uniref:Apple domain-containing protein n=1 Tax=Capitella teleta TaxID=283909 RepID=R7VIZ9_CAPTE|nr:hypothetical protein CAPTEDRAFT_209065 [Capitella teleta]|eukprot:ELU16276.1 hypothetical protein CAPTEDRAFT_209065 [Capitella teleta]
MPGTTNFQFNDGTRNLFFTDRVEVEAIGIVSGEVVDKTTDIPEGYAAYPAISVAGGSQQSGAFTGEECTLACVNEPTCVAFDYTYGDDGSGNIVGQCYFNELATKCGTIGNNTISYHMAELPVCTTGVLSLLIGGKIQSGGLRTADNRLKSEAKNWASKTAAGTNHSS